MSSASTESTGYDTSLCSICSGLFYWLAILCVCVWGGACRRHLKSLFYSTVRKLLDVFQFVTSFTLRFEAMLASTLLQLSDFSVVYLIFLKI